MRSLRYEIFKSAILFERNKKLMSRHDYFQTKSMNYFHVKLTVTFQQRENR